MLKRIYDDLQKLLTPGKALVIYGPRRVGKTTLLKKFLSQTKLKYKLVSGDDILVQQILSSRNFSMLGDYIQGYTLLAIDEAQQIPHIGAGLKIIVDQFPTVTVIATGSSSFDLARDVGEPLTGRKRTISLFPISQLEMAFAHNPHELKERLPVFLIFGSYPEVVIAKTDRERKEILSELVSSYLFKDILALEKIKSPHFLIDILKLLAFQVGSEVSLNELAEQLNLDVKTVARYIDLLEKTFVLFELGGLSRNLRKEVTSKKKYFFWDNGIRNAIISQFNSLDSRNDIGALWENFILTERAKKRAYKNIYCLPYFWRTYDQQEIDLVEEKDGKFYAYECKWSPRKKVRKPRAWAEGYAGSKFQVITPDNYLDFIT